MRVYLAAPYALRDILGTFAEDLEARGHECTSTWLEADHDLTPGALGTSPDQDDDYVAQHVEGDIEDVSRSDVLVLFTWDYSRTLALPREDIGPNSGGRHVETGIALALGIPVIVLGEPENIFHRGVGRLAPAWLDVLLHLDVIHNSRFPADRVQ